MCNWTTAGDVAELRRGSKVGIPHISDQEGEDADTFSQAV